MEKGRIVCVDGGMGTMIQRYGLDYNGPPEVLNETHPDVIESIHRAYIEAGAEIIETNSFGLSRIKLANYGMQDKAYQLSYLAAKIARKAAKGTKVLVAGSVGPLGKLLKPIGDISFVEAYEAFREQIKGLKDGGADLIFVETMSDLREAKAAIIAAKDLRMPVFAMMTFQDNGKTLLGVTPEAAAVALEAMGVEALGANCSTGPELMLKVAQKMASVTDKPLIFMPNAGVPQMIDGETVFPMGPEEFVSYAEDFVELGACYLGGCCGTTPDHIRYLKEKINHMRPVKREAPKGLKVAGRDRVVFIGTHHYPVVIGERINPTGKKQFQEELQVKKATWAIMAAQSQKDKGADILDVNVGMGGIDEVELLPFICSAVQLATGLPVMIDSSSIEAIEEALKVVEGKPIINSSVVEDKRLDAFLTLAKRYGAALLVLTMDERGIPETPEGRVDLAVKAKQKAKIKGFSPDDLLIDCLVMAVSADRKAAKTTLEAVKLAKEKGFNTVLGVSNVSFGLPAREIVNAAFLSAALCNGLDAGIINPENEKVMEAFYAGSLLAGRDAKASRYIQFFGSKKQATEKKADVEESVEERLRRSIIDGDDALALELTQKLMDKLPPLTIINDILIPAMQEVGDMYERGEYFLPQLMAAAKAMKAAFGVIKEATEGESREPKGTVILATVEGDIHDIGKNIVAMLLENNGYRVIDLGKNVPKEKIVAAAKKYKPDAVGLSALMTTTMMEMKNVIEELKRHGIKVFTMVGGAVVTKEFAESIGADAYAENAVEAVKIMDRWMEKKK
ncbi:homocysteine S-methyltransferase family protein [Thermosulfidibacter takaii]|uniref:homocysteine S-methyltransferase family protein n=1 Tax=Thermosulfidibacter takaii TaxID=412593 RepID=UPI000837BFA9|nr:homocysteine S-methyltransferase family protein [Thermosulfidibacter takaii]